MIRAILTALLAAILLATTVSSQQEEPTQVEGKLVELSVLEGMANNANSGKLVTVLLTLERADVVSSATSVERTFDREQAPNIQPVSRSNSMFISGPAAVVQEAVVRLRALDAATPEKPTRSYRPQNPEETAFEVAGEASDDSDMGMKFSLITVVGGIALLAIFVALVVRRPFR